MGRKRLTQLFPCLLSLRKWQRKLFFYGKMRIDGRKYARETGETTCKELCYQSQSTVANLHNLRSACSAVNGLLIRPGETFSFWQLVRHAEVEDGVGLSSGEGLCQLADELFWCFLHTPLTIVERHPRAVLDFPASRDGRPPGMDATINEGWMDLKMRNDTASVFQLRVFVEDGYLKCAVYCERPVWTEYRIVARDVKYLRYQGEIYQTAKLYCQSYDKRQHNMMRSEYWLYENRVRIGYQLPEGMPIVGESA